MPKVILYAVTMGVVVLMIGTLNSGVQIDKNTDANYDSTIVLTENGFEPQKLNILKGGTVTWKTTRNSYFWPASNIHPTHEIYKEFDPQKPISPDKSWDFKFDRVGEWRYHDHNAPYYTGTIIVHEKNDDKSDKTLGRIDCNKPELLNLDGKEECWDRTLGKTIEDKGLSAAFKVFKKIYERDADFAKNGCHWYAHRLGEESYARKDRDWLKNFPPESSYCGYGFVHGFLEHAFRQIKDLDKSVKLCDYLDKELNDSLPRLRLNCYHAIGHGFVDDPPPSKIWGDPYAIIETSLKTCEKISNAPAEEKECFDGAFNTLVIFMRTNQYELELDNEDPLGFCKDVHEKYQNSCYYEFAQTLDSLRDRNLAKIAELVKDIKDDSVAQMIINAAAAGMVAGDIVKEDLASYIYECRSTGERTRLQCIIGVGGGILAHGNPGKEYIKALEFCKSPILLVDEQEACYKNLSHGIKNIYPEEKTSKICSEFEPKYKTYCE